MKRFVMRKGDEYARTNPYNPTKDIQDARIYGRTTPERTTAWRWGYRPVWVSIVEAGEIDRRIDRTIAALRSYRCQYTVDNDHGDPLDLVDVLSSGSTIETGINEIELLAEHVAPSVEGEEVSDEDLDPD